MNLLVGIFFFEVILNYLSSFLLPHSWQIPSTNRYRPGYFAFKLPILVNYEDDVGLEFLLIRYLVKSGIDPAA